MKFRSLWLTALAWSLGSGCAPAPENGDRPNLLLITIDTLRSDHCSVYGYDHDTTPNLRRLAEEGARFDLAYAPTSTTGPTHASILTGLYPPTHGVVKNGLELAERHETLAEILAARGYQTAAVVSSYILDSLFGYAQGFATYQDDFDPATSTMEFEAREGQEISQGYDSRADATTRRAMRWLWEDRDRNHPFLLFVHYFDPHEPYGAPGAFARRFPPPPADPAGRPRASQETREEIRQYDGEIAFTDQEIGRLLETLEREGLAENTLVVITADHGEGLMDHDIMGHGVYIYEELVRVPLLLRWPGRIPPGRSFAEPVEQVDLAPTLLDLIGAPFDSQRFQGRSLAASLLGDAPLDPDRPVYLQRRHYTEEFERGIRVKGEQYAIRWGRWKYIDASDQGRTELYDLETDPGEQVDRSRDEPHHAARLAERLAAWRQRQTGERPVRAISTRDREALEALGYVE
jgi:arylsulfatase A-like enzyme